jgi:hypothetical protein
MRPLTAPNLNSHSRNGLTLTLSQCHHVVGFLAGSTPTHGVHGQHPEAVHGKGIESRHLVAGFVTAGRDSIVYVPLTVLTDPVKSIKSLTLI